MNGFIYLLLEVDHNGNEFHKIGISKNHPSKRLKNLQTGNPNKIEILKIYESINYKRIEKWLHSKFSNKKTLAENEWFKLTDDDVIKFSDTCKKIEETINMLLKENYFYK